MEGASSSCDIFTPDGRYRIDGSEMGLLGSGAHGIVRIAQDVHTLEHVAVKITPTSVVCSSCKEMTALVRLTSPHVVQLLGVQVDMTRQKVYVLMELCQGGELFDRIAECGGLPEPDARRYFVQILSALRHCHSNHVFHRDLKPENILLDEEDNAKVADFGLAAVYKNVVGDASYLQHTKVGSVMYAAPEVLTSSSRTGYNAASADMWSLGIVLFSMLSGTLPFECAAASRCKRYAAVLQQGIQVMCPEHLSQQVSTLLSRLLHPDPLQRFTPEQALACEWLQETGGSQPLSGAGASEPGGASRHSPRCWKVVFQLAHRPPPQQPPQPQPPAAATAATASQPQQQPPPPQPSQPPPQPPSDPPPPPPPQPPLLPGLPPPPEAGGGIPVLGGDAAGGLPAVGAARDASETLRDAARSPLKRGADEECGRPAQGRRIGDESAPAAAAAAADSPSAESTPAAIASAEPQLVGSSEEVEAIPRRGVLADYVGRWGWGSLPDGTQELLRDIFETLRGLGLQYSLLEQCAEGRTADTLQLSINFSAEPATMPLPPRPPQAPPAFAPPPPHAPPAQQHRMPPHKL
uniref:Protein kinase domain-containing protein n=1 Tax=Emiliania huxleyi TaxID=2903 RepID=A0A7S3S995_EMIHU|mmetsp:Transcript_225/g.686  ORF Transcript_225/g.686 Transcript_225/m.686 type:complete len:578 (+) Transcript_225:146-1879(+)